VKFHPQKVTIETIDFDALPPPSISDPDFCDAHDERLLEGKCEVCQAIFKENGYGGRKRK